MHTYFLICLTQFYFMRRKHTFKKQRGQAAQNQYVYVSVTYEMENSIYKGKNEICDY